MTPELRVCGPCLADHDLRTCEHWAPGPAPKPTSLAVNDPEARERLHHELVAHITNGGPRVRIDQEL